MKSLPPKAHIDVTFEEEEGGEGKRPGQVSWPYVQSSMKKKNFKPNVAAKHLFWWWAHKNLF